MSQISPGLAAASSTEKSLRNPERSQDENSFNNLDINHFFKLMIAELQNQDPLDPMDNKDLLAQISQIRQIGSNDKLTETLNSVLLGQNITSATSLIGAEIDGISTDNQKVTGIVQRVTIENGKPKLHLDAESLAKTTQVTEGNMEAGTYNYQAVWETTDGKKLTVPLSVKIESGSDDNAVRLTHLPKTNGIKKIYRTDKSGTGKLHLVGVLTDGNTGSFLDKSSDAERSNTILSGKVQQASANRKFEVTLNNVGEIRPQTKTAA